jgi:hypothetical protein
MVGAKGFKPGPLLPNQIDGIAAQLIESGTVKSPLASVSHVEVGWSKYIEKALAATVSPWKGAGCGNPSHSR